MYYIFLKYACLLINNIHVYLYYYNYNVNYFILSMCFLNIFGFYFIVTELYFTKIFNIFIFLKNFFYYVIIL